MKNLIKSIKVLSFVFVSFFSVSALAQSEQDLVNNIAKTSAYSLMKQVSPNTGFNASAKGITYSFNTSTNTLTIKFEAYWNAKRYMLASSYETFNIDGILTIDLDSEDVRFTPTYKNSAVVGAWSNADALFTYEIAKNILASN